MTQVNSEIALSVLTETEHHRAQLSADLLAAIVELSGDAIIGIAPDGRISSCNPAAEHLYGYPGHEIVGLPFDVLDCDEDGNNVRQALARAQRGERFLPFEARQRCKNGRSVHALLSMAPVRDSQGNVAHVAVLAHDITQTRQLEEQFRQAQKMEAVGRFAGGIAHDFNNLLTVVLGCCEIAVSRLQPSDPVVPFLEEIDKAGKRAADLTRQLLAFSRRQVLSPEVFDLNKLIQDMEKMLGRLAGENIQLVTHLTAADAHVVIDPGQMEQLILNLVVNARDAISAHGRISLETGAVQLNARSMQGQPGRPPGAYVTLTVSDDGHGMSPETQAKIFEPFFSTKGPGRGAGLGLPTVYGIVQQSGGFIVVDSLVGVGSSFKVYLPAAHHDRVSCPPKACHPHALAGNETILLVEDEPGVRVIAKRALELKGYTVLEADNGQEALELANRYSGTIDLLLADVVMPKLGGKQLADRFRRTHPDVPVLFMSGYTHNAILERGIPLADTELLPKPFTFEALLQRIREVLDRTALAGALAELNVG